LENTFSLESKFPPIFVDNLPPLPSSLKSRHFPNEYGKGGLFKGNRGLLPPTVHCEVAAMETFYLVCAIAGSTLIVCQFLMTLLGLGGGHDFGGHDGGLDVGGGHEWAGSIHDTGHDGGHDHGSSWFFSLLTFRTVSAAVAFFGLAGLAAHEHLDAWYTLSLAIVAGGGALVIVAWLMRLLTRMNVDGTARIERSVGSRGTVYLSIPAGRGGVGKVHVSLQNRTLEYNAVTSKEELPTGAKIVVVSVVSADTVEVAPLVESERTNHA
jgi:hypothetical protein